MHSDLPEPNAAIGRPDLPVSAVGTPARTGEETTQRVVVAQQPPGGADETVSREGVHRGVQQARTVARAPMAGTHHELAHQPIARPRIRIVAGPHGDEADGLGLHRVHCHEQPVTGERRMHDGLPPAVRHLRWAGQELGQAPL